MWPVTGKTNPLCQSQGGAGPARGMDLIQVGVSVTGSWKKISSCQSQGGAGPARRAKWSLHFVHNLCLVWPLFCDLLPKGKSHPKKSTILISRYGRRSCLPIHPNVLLVKGLFLIYFTRNCVGVVPNLHPVVFLQSIGLELFISSWTASDFGSTLSLHCFSLTLSVMPIQMAFL